MAGTALAHHFKGLPHFNYFENYPQVPQDEYLWQEGDYEFSLVIYDFQGITREDADQPDDVRLYLVVWDLRANRIYNGALDLTILDRDRAIYTRRFSSAAEENIYSFQRVLPETGRYSLRVSTQRGPGPEAVIPFKLSSQKRRWGKWVAGVLVGFVVVVAVGSRRARVMQDRRDSARAARAARGTKKERQAAPGKAGNA